MEYGINQVVKIYSGGLGMLAGDYLKSYFEGKKELFKGLAIEKLEKDWNHHRACHRILRRETDGRKKGEQICLSTVFLHP